MAERHSQKTRRRAPGARRAAGLRRNRRATLAAIAPQLQSLLDGALSAGGWFDDAHEAIVLKTATQPDPDQRIAEVRNFVLEQTRLGMLVGVAVGWELAERLRGERRSDADVIQ